jgi:hypothetical protein
VTDVHVLFTLREGLTAEERSRVLDEICRWDGISSTGPLRPKATTPLVTRMAFAYVNDEDAARVIERLKQHPDIECAELPPPRRIV